MTLTNGNYQLFSTVRGQLTFGPFDNFNPCINDLGEIVWSQFGPNYGLVSTMRGLLPGNYPTAYGLNNNDEFCYQNNLTISNFSTDGTISPATNSGGVTGSLPGHVALTDATSFFNELLINITLGSYLTFSFTPTNNFTGPQPTGFSGLFVDPTTNFQLFPTTDPTGADVLFLLTIDGVTPGGHLDVYAAANGEVSIAAGVPEPSTWAMMVLGFAGVGFMAFRRKRNETTHAGA